MARDEQCNASDGTTRVLRCELSRWHDGDHWMFDNTKDGISWPLTDEEKLGRETKRLSLRLGEILRSVDCVTPIRVDVVLLDSTGFGFEAIAQLSVVHLRALLEIIERRGR